MRCCIMSVSQACFFYHASIRTLAEVCDAVIFGCGMSRMHGNGVSCRLDVMEEVF